MKQTSKHFLFLFITTDIVRIVFISYISELYLKKKYKNKRFKYKTAFPICLSFLLFMKGHENQTPSSDTDGVLSEGRGGKTGKKATSTITRNFTSSFLVIFSHTVWDQAFRKQTKQFFVKLFGNFYILLCYLEVLKT